MVDLKNLLKVVLTKELVLGSNCKICDVEKIMDCNMSTVHSMQNEKVEDCMNLNFQLSVARVI